METQLHRITLAESGEVFSCPETVSVLQAMASLGKRGIPVGCRGGGCGVCKVHVISGAYASERMSRAHISEAEEASGCVLACRISPRADMLIEVIGTMKRAIAAPSGADSDVADKRAAA